MATPNFVPPFTLIREGGRTYVYDDLAALEEACRAGGICVGDGHKLPVAWHERLFGGVPAFRHNEWIARDHFGRTVTMADIRAARPLPRYRWDYRRDAQVMAAERGLPIPYTGNWKRGRGLFRRPRHIGVYRAAEIARVVERAEGWKIKGKIVQPPNAWDDICASDWGHRTWKRSRRTRWRKPAVSFRMLDRGD